MNSDTPDLTELNQTVNNLVNTVEFDKNEAHLNSGKLAVLQEPHDKLFEVNTGLREELDALRKETNEIEQYLRIDNVEIVGLPPAYDESSDEGLCVQTFFIVRC